MFVPSARFSQRNKDLNPMSDAKTTIVGMLLVVAAAMTLTAHALTTGITALDLQNLFSALAGVGLILAKDSA
ncbi:MAG: hypothetical protein ABSD31_21130 [Candidatus Binataceae bacterium]